MNVRWVTNIFLKGSFESMAPVLFFAS